jgi:hypothetical protein
MELRTMHCPTLLPEHSLVVLTLRWLPRKSFATRNFVQRKWIFSYFTAITRRRGGSISIVTTLRAARPGFDSRQGWDCFWAATSRSGLQSTPPTTQWVPRDLYLGIKRPGCEGDHSPPSTAEVKDALSYTSTPSYCFHGVFLTLATGTTLHLPVRTITRNTVTWDKTHVNSST